MTARRKAGNEEETAVLGTVVAVRDETLPARNGKLPALPGPTGLGAIPTMAGWTPPEEPSPETKAVKAWGLLLVEGDNDAAAIVRRLITEHVNLVGAR